MAFGFRTRSKFALLAVNGIYEELPDSEFQLSDGTWVMPRVPVNNLGIWKEWIGSISAEKLARANLVLLVDEVSDNPEILDGVHQRLGDGLSRLFCFLHLRQGVETAESNDADLLLGSCEQAEPGIRQMSQLPSFHQSKGYRRNPVTREWLEETVALRAGVEALKAATGNRAIRGLNVLFKGLQGTGQDRCHQFVRSLEALVLPDVGKTRKQFVNRCQTFARAGADAAGILGEAFDMRSDTEHLQDWNRAVIGYPEADREDVCWQRTRRMEFLSCSSYSRILRNSAIRVRFQSDSDIAAFWSRSETVWRKLWGEPVDITTEPLVKKYHPSVGRAIS